MNWADGQAWLWITLGGRIPLRCLTFRSPGVSFPDPSTFNDVSDANDGPDLDRAIGRGAREHVLAHPMLTFAEADAVLGRPSTAFELAALDGSLIAMADNGTMRVPLFQLDSERGRVRPIVVEVNVLIGAGSNPWGCASWWFTPSAALPDGMSPADATIAGGHDALIRREANAVAAAWEPTTLPMLGMTLDEARSRLTALHFAKEALTPPEREILQIAWGLLRLLDQRLAGGATAR